MVRYPLFPEISNFNRDLAALKSLRQVRMYFPSSIDTSFAAALDSVELIPLLWTSEKSTFQNSPYDINPLTQQGKYNYDQAYLPLGVLLQGKFTSFWKDKSVPLNDDGEPITEDDIIPVSPETRIVVFGDAFFFQDQYVVQGLDNLTLVLNVIDWLAQDERLITIRSREVSSRPIGEVSDNTRRTVKYANLLIPPLLVILFGLFRWRVRKTSKKTALKDFRYSGQGGKE